MEYTTQKDTLTIPELCRMMGVSKQYLYKRYFDRGEGPKRTRVKIGRYWRVTVDRAEADAFVAKVFSDRAKRIVLETQRKAKRHPVKWTLELREAA